VGRISPDAVTQAAEIIKRAMPKNEADIARWFGCHVTAGGSDGAVEAPEQELSSIELFSRWTEEGSLLRRADVKFAFVQDVSDGSLAGIDG
jgi:50S ribosomal protein L16 3-hydroxylase